MAAPVSDHKISGMKGEGKKYPDFFLKMFQFIDEHSVVITIHLLLGAVTIIFSFISLHVVIVSLLVTCVYMKLRHGTCSGAFKLPGDDDPLGQISRDFPVIAHKGGGHCGPENTLTAIKQAHQRGVKAIEFDVGMTKDNVPVVIHDSTVNRTTDGEGEVKDLTRESIQTLNAAAHHPLRESFGHVTVPTLVEVVELCLQLDLFMFVDVKESSNSIVAPLLQLFKDHPDLYKKAYICSFQSHLIYKVRQADKAIHGALTYRPKQIYKTATGSLKQGLSLWFLLIAPILDTIYSWMFQRWLWFICGVKVILLNNNAVSKDVVNYWKERGIELVIWTVNDKQQQAMFTEVMNCAYITDCVGACPNPLA